jgi:hypothetical protein
LETVKPAVFFAAASTTDEAAGVETTVIKIHFA